MIIGIFAVLALVVDGAGRLQALAKAEGTAQEAARAGAQALDVGQAIQGQGFTVDTSGQAAAAARAYLTQAGVTGTVTPTATISTSPSPPPTARCSRSSAPGR
ncbi:hypothetical protein ACFQZC_38250 [Streptacidiphilus monticola]